jgi:RimJ/RimL family protein N-acetyltransferase
MSADVGGAGPSDPGEGDGRAPRRPVPVKPIVRGEAVWLRPIDEDDLDAYLAAVVEHEPGWWAGYPGGWSMREVRGWFDRIVERHGKDGYWFTICPLGSDEFIGTVWLWDIRHRWEGAEISIYVARPGHGVGTDAINAAVDFGFQTVGLPRIWGFTDDHNARSRRAFESCGFVVEGTIRAGHRHQGRPADLVQFSMTLDDWLALERPKSWDLNTAQGSRGPGPDRSGQVPGTSLG